MDSVYLNTRSVAKSSGRSYLHNHRVARGWNRTNKKKHKGYRKANLLGVRMSDAMRCCSSAETSDMQCVAGNCDVTTATLIAALHIVATYTHVPRYRSTKFSRPSAHVHTKLDTCSFSCVLFFIACLAVTV
jgi:hypothetical protein